MTYDGHALDPNAGYGFAGGDRARAFAQARRHSTLVRFLKRAIVVGAAAIMIMLIAVTFFDPFGKLPGNVAIDRATLNGTRITMEAPKLSGFRKDGRPYEVRARTGTQDVRSPKVIELNEIEARIHMDERTTINVSAPSGVFDSGGDTMKLLSGGGEYIRITSNSGYDITMSSAQMNLKAGNLVSREPVNVRMNAGTIAADGLDVADGGKRITFNGNVHTVLKPAGVDDSPAPANGGEPHKEP